MTIADRLLTIVVTATLTSLAWIVVGNTSVVRDTGAPPSASPARAETAAAQSSGTGPRSEAGANDPLLVPVAGIMASQLTDTFNQTRGGERRHEALDIVAPAGTTVIAAAPGTIEKLFKSDAGGNTVYVRSGDRRTIYYYAHLLAYAPGLEEGQVIGRGDRLGTVGSTGNADPASPHLHFAVTRTTAEARWWEPGVAVNPYPLLAIQD